MSQWEALAKSLGHAGEKEMWDELYTKRKLSLDQLATKLACSPHTVRNRLQANQVVVRQRGGPNSQKVEVNPELLAKIRRLGIPATAKLLNVAPQTLYNRLYYSLGLKKRDLEKSPEPEPTVQPPESPEST